MAKNLDLPEYGYRQLSEELNINISGDVDGFGGCSRGACKTVNIGPNTKIKGQYFFEECKSLKRIDFGQNVSITGNNTFIGCSSLTELDAPTGFRLFGN